MENTNRILRVVDQGLTAQFCSTYSWANMIDDLELTAEEKDWAKDHICYKAYILSERSSDEVHI